MGRGVAVKHSFVFRGSDPSHVPVGSDILSFAAEEAAEPQPTYTVRGYEELLELL